MFAKLTGKIDTLMTDSLILDVGGVGYHVFASGRTLGLIGGVGDPAALMIDTHVREDHIHLYGFASVQERDWFRLLTGVQGVGAKSALAILTVCPAERLPIVIASNDVAVLRQADGVGPKLAARIASELKDKVQHMTLGAAAHQPPAPKAPQKSSAKVEEIAPPVDLSIDHDAVSALVNLGYGRAEAFSAVMTARQKSNDNQMSFDSLLKSALKELAG
ncbi:MAG TPA: Holliday junction branch migration protein RuvA [Alphaproteobacteria bacterium]|nr:Holliday junction branch migration protein RuvA [Alphaproteobacteria bacterium]HNS44779.1 Holliday junction branch migration protein RuvA [Alphaproteobacteria bacterium]